jgi:hypothetical protein
MHLVSSTQQIAKQALCTLSCSWGDKLKKKGEGNPSIPFHPIHIELFFFCFALFCGNGKGCKAEAMQRRESAGSTWTETDWWQFHFFS